MSWIDIAIIAAYIVGTTSATVLGLAGIARVASGEAFTVFRRN